MKKFQRTWWDNHDSKQIVNLPIGKYQEIFDGKKVRRIKVS